MTCLTMVYLKKCVGQTYGKNKFPDYANFDLDIEFVKIFLDE